MNLSLKKNQAEAAWRVEKAGQKYKALTFRNFMA